MGLIKATDKGIEKIVNEIEQEMAEDMENYMDIPINTTLDYLLTDYDYLDKETKEKIRNIIIEDCMM